MPHAPCHTFMPHAHATVACHSHMHMPHAQASSSRRGKGANCVASGTWAPNGAAIAADTAPSTDVSAVESMSAKASSNGDSTSGDAIYSALARAALEALAQEDGPVLEYNSEDLLRIERALIDSLQAWKDPTGHGTDHGALDNGTPTSADDVVAKGTSAPSTVPSSVDRGDALHTAASPGEEGRPRRTRQSLGAELRQRRASASPSSPFSSPVMRLMEGVKAKAEDVVAASYAGIFGEHWWHVLSCFTDGGPEVKRGRLKIASFIAPLEFVFFIDGSCIFHSGHLIVHDGLKAIDEWLKSRKLKYGIRVDRYVGNLAKKSNCWRSNSAKMAEKWMLLVGNLEGCTSSTCPPLSSSWRVCLLV